MSSGKYATADVGAVPKASFGTRMKHHFKRFWWLHLIVFIIVVLVIALPLVYVGYPNIAQGDINSSSLEVKSIEISNPTPDSFHLKQTQLLKTDSIYHPYFYEFDANASLAGAPEPFAIVQIPSMTARNNHAIKVDQTVDLNHPDAFGGFSKALLMNKEVDLNLFGRPNLKLGALPKITVTYNKTITLTGLNRLEGFKVTDVSISAEKDPDGTNMNGTVHIPNASVCTIPMGNITMDISAGGKQVGQAFIDDLTLVPGDNTSKMKASVDQMKVITLIAGKFSDSNGVIPFDISGNKSVYHGEELPYFTEALKSATLHTKINVTEGLMRGGGEGGLI